MSLHAMLVAILAGSGGVLAVAAWAFRAPISSGHRISEDKRRRPKGSKLVRSAVLNSLVSITMALGVTYVFYDGLFYEGAPSGWRMGIEIVGTMALYDFFYYLTHRFLFHEWKGLRGVHAVHHVTKYPTAMDALYLHPLETAIGLGLLLGCTWLVGPVNVYSFAITFSIYTVLNILIHWGIDAKVFGLRTIGYLARKHDLHHQGMQAGNYASITPLWDVVFGTYE